MTVVPVLVFSQESPTDMIFELVPLLLHTAPPTQRFSLFTPVLEQVDPTKHLLTCELVLHSLPIKHILL
jgi:hypothetical protein